MIVKIFNTFEYIKYSQMRAPMKKWLIAFLLLQTHFAVAQSSINVMFYNIYRFPEKPPANREFILKQILNEYQPDLFMVCELISEEGADKILTTSLQTPGNIYKRATFVPAAIDNTDPLQQMVYYNKHKFTLLRQTYYPTQVRDINHYTFVLNALDIANDSVYLDVFVTHLKSSEGAANAQLRASMIDTFVTKLAALPPNRHVLLAGDFNFYSADENEPAYLKIINPTNPIVMVDPIDIPGNWHDNDTFKSVHTQATRLSAEGFGIGGATGGMDDRFDFIMMSENFKTNNKLYYEDNTYKAYGNNGNCFNNRIDAFDCDGEYSLDLRRNLYNMSDHTPVVMLLKTNKQFVSISEKEKMPAMEIVGSNMVRDQLRLKVNRTLYNAPVLVYNSLGQPVAKTMAGNHNGAIRIDVSHLPQGFYYLHIASEGGSVLKFIKQ